MNDLLSNPPWLINFFIRRIASHDGCSIRHRNGCTLSCLHIDGIGYRDYQHRYLRLLPQIHTRDVVLEPLRRYCMHIVDQAPLSAA